MVAVDVDGAVNPSSLHIFFIPFLARGHIIPLVDTARLFALRGARCSVVTTPGNSSYILPTIHQYSNLDLLLVPFPSAEVGLPPGVECSDALPDDDADDAGSFGFSGSAVKLYRGMQLLQHPIERLVVEHRPDCIVADSTLFWTVGFASSRSIPLFRFAVFAPFSKAVLENIYTRGANIVDAGSETVGPLLDLPHPHPLELARAEVLDCPPSYFVDSREAESNSCGLLFNSFDEMAPEYVEHCKTKTLSGDPINVWCIGPVPLGKSPDAGGDWDGIKKWLDAKENDSVLYVSFGSECHFSVEQLREIAVGLQSCKHSFIWVVRGKGGGAETMDEWMPEEFRPSVGDRGLILTEWAPQVAILNHRAIGGFLAHCGWNSVVETVCAGLPVIAWPLHWEQFIHERLVIEVLRIGLRLLEGVKMRSVDVKGKGIVKGEAIREAVDRLLGGGDEEAREVRRNAKKYKELARAAMEEGGSSYVNLSRVIEQMVELAKKK